MISFSDLTTKLGIHRDFARRLRNQHIAGGRILMGQTKRRDGRGLRGRAASVFLEPHEAARALFLYDLYKQLRPQRKVMLELYERLEPAFTSKYAKETTIRDCAGLSLTVDVEHYLRQIRLLTSK